MSEQSEWVSLGEAASILGVHPTTVRHWADSGELTSRRTPGGHRRFRRSDLAQWASMRNKETAPNEAKMMIQSALGRARLEIIDGELRNLPWYDQLDNEDRRSHGMLGRRLLELLARYLSGAEDESNILDEVRVVGLEYAQLSLNQGLQLRDTVQAFLFFRDVLIDSVIQMSEMLSLHTPSDWGHRLRQVHHVTDHFLLALIEGYQV